MALIKRWQKGFRTDPFRHLNTRSKVIVISFLPLRIFPWWFRVFRASLRRASSGSARKDSRTRRQFMGRKSVHFAHRNLKLQYWQTSYWPIL